MHTTALSTKDMLKKIKRFFREDSNHEGVWILVVSHMETLTKKIKCILRYLDIKVIESGHVQKIGNFGAKQAEIYTKLTALIYEGKDWFTKEAKYTIDEYGEKYKVAINKVRAKSNNQREKIDSQAIELKHYRTNKEANKTMNENKKITNLSRTINQLKETKSKPIDNQTEKKITIREKTLHVLDLVKDTPSLLALSTEFFQRLKGLKSRIKKRLG